MKTMKKLFAVMLIAVMTLTMVGCGELSMDKIKGDWTLDTVDGKSIDEYAASLGIDPSMIGLNWTINEDDTMTQANAATSSKLLMARKSNGFELYEESDTEKKTIVMSVEYKDDKLECKMDMGTGAVTVVMKKGKADLTAAPAAPATDAAQ